MVTASVDKSVKVWDVLDAAPAPTLVATKAMAVGQLFSAQFDVGAPFLLAVGGSKGVVALWEMNEDRSISSAFSGRDALASQLQHTKPAFSFEPPPSAAAPPPAGPPAASSVGPAGDAPAPAGPGSAKAKKKSKSRRGGK
jgi:periodic tryptophan protein 1